MSTSDWIALGQLILSLVAGVLAVFGYLRIIKSTDENARERKIEIERIAKERQAEMVQNADTVHEGLQEMSRIVLYGARRDKYTVMSLMLLMGLFFWWISGISLKLKKRVGALEGKKKR